MKEISLEKMIQTMCTNDFNETSTIKLNSRVIKDAEEVSSEEKKRQQRLVKVMLCLFLFRM